MLGAHFDSWHSGTGATDNGAGSAVMIEVMRLLKALNLKLRPHGSHRALERRRAGTPRLARLREGALRRPRDMKPNPSTTKLSGYFNVDNGSGKIRGVYLQGNEAMRPIFDAVAGAVQGSRRHDASPSATPAAPTTCRSTPSDCPASSSSRIRWTTARARTTRYGYL